MSASLHAWSSVKVEKAPIANASQGKGTATCATSFAICRLDSGCNGTSEHNIDAGWGLQKVCRFQDGANGFPNVSQVRFQLCPRQVDTATDSSVEVADDASPFLADDVAVAIDLRRFFGVFRKLRSSGMGLKLLLGLVF